MARLKMEGILKWNGLKSQGPLYKLTCSTVTLLGWGSYTVEPAL